MGNNWWADKLGTTPQTPAPVTPQYSAPATPQVSAPPTPQYSAPNVTEQLPAPIKAQSAKQVEPCPNCYGGNYMSNVGARKRCYDCGYPLIQSGSGASSVSSGAAATPAKQRGQSGGYNPNIIVGKVD